VWLDLLNAFAAAPPKLQKRLCLTTVFINPNTCATTPCFGTSSWGLRNPIIPSGQNDYQRYIALSQSLWPPSGQPAEIYSQYETDLIAQVLAQLQSAWPTNPTGGPAIYPNPPTFSQNIGLQTYNTSAMTILAALSHEYGHILWYDAIKGAGNNNNYDPSPWGRTSAMQPWGRTRGMKPRGRSSGTKNGFFDNSWQQVSRPNQFVNFASLPDGDLHLGSIQTSNLITAIQAAQWTTAGLDLYLLYNIDPSGSDSNAVWPSLFGAVSPEEDFVETFKIYIMTNKKTNNGAYVSSLPLYIYTVAGANATYSPDIYNAIDGNNKHELIRKMNIIDSNFN
jgi:hypothetical protein